MKRKNKLIVKVMVVLLCILVVVGVLVFRNKKNENGEKEDTKVNNSQVENTEVDNEELYVEDTEGFDIKTSYGNLQFPVMWNDSIKTEIVKKDDCEIVEFWVELEEKDKIHLFDIIFGGEGYQIGSIKTSDSEEVAVCVESYSYELDDTWTDSDKAILSAVDHDINYLLENLTSLEGFTPVE